MPVSTSYLWFDTWARRGRYPFRLDLPGAKVH